MIWDLVKMRLNHKVRGLPNGVGLLPGQRVAASACVISWPQIWRELFSPLHALNFGIGGDSTQHVLWRLENGELEHIRPKVSEAWVVG